MVRYSNTIVLVVVLAAWAPTQADEPAADQAPTFVSQLADEDFFQREKAARALIAMGLSARQALTGGLKHRDAEVRFRCQRILVMVTENDFQRRLEAFANDTSQTSEYDLVGWREFQTMAGDDRRSRSLFVEMQRAEADLIERAVTDPKRAGSEFTKRCETLNNELRTPSTVRQPIRLGSVATLLFVATLADVEITSQMANRLYGFCYQKSVQDAMTAGERRDPLRKLMGAYIEQSDPSSSYQVLMMAMRYDIKAGLKPAEVVIRGSGQQPHVVQYAILATAKLGGRDQIPLLELLLDDDTVCSTRTTNRVVVKTQLRDVALAGLFHLTGRDARAEAFPAMQNHSQMLFNPSTLGFESEAKREAALKKWRALREKEKGRAG